MSRSLHPEFLALAAARLDGPLPPADEDRLSRHLAACGACRRRVAGYEADRLALRGLREVTPPRDLWARTSAALDREQARGAGRASPAARRAAWRPIGSRRGALGAVLALVVIGAVLGSGLLSGLGGPLGPMGLAQATPLDVQPGNLAYVSTRDGQAGVYVGRISRVCPENTAAYCQPIETDAREVASFASDFVPQQLTISPDGRTGAVVGVSASGDIVYTIRFPDLAGTTPTVAPSESPAGTPRPSQRGTPIASASPTLPSPSASATGSATPGASPGPEAIIEHILVVGETPAYSADGTMLAFSAMPADRSSGPDIYVWRAGSESAVALTNDHGSIFASWAGTSIVGSRAGKRSASGVTPASFLLDASTGASTPLARPAWRPIVDPTGRYVIFFDGAIAADTDGLTWHEQLGGLYLAPWRLFDPNAPTPAEPTPAPTGTATPLPGTGATTTPTEHGSAAPTEAASASTGSGAEVGTEPPTQSPSQAPTAKPTEQGQATEPNSSASPTASPAASRAASLEPETLVPGRDYQTDPILSWEAHWSPDGAWFGAWIGDNASGQGGSEQAGSLTVAAVDRATGHVDRDRVELDRAPALRGFALGDHRIAWTTLPGPDGASHVRLLVWTDHGRGVVRTGAGDNNDALPAF